MKYIDKQTQHIRELLYPIIGTTRAKTYFSYYGIMKDDVMFALYKNGNFYLHISKDCLAEVIQYPAITLLSDVQYGIYSKSFYRIPECITKNLSYYTHWITQSIAEITASKKLQQSKKKQFIRALPNMNIQLERMLKKLDIYSPDELIQQGEITIFIKLLKLGIDVDQMMLFRLYGAITHQYIYTLSDQEKQSLLQEANSALYEAGLRKRFKVKS